MDILSFTPDKQVKFQYWLDVLRQCSHVWRYLIHTIIPCSSSAAEGQTGSRQSTMENGFCLLYKRYESGQLRLPKEKVDFLIRKLYGPKSEKTATPGIEGQMSLFNEIECCADPAGNRERHIWKKH